MRLFLKGALKTEKKFFLNKESKNETSKLFSKELFLGHPLLGFKLFSEITMRWLKTKFLKSSTNSS